MSDDRALAGATAAVSSPRTRFWTQMFRNPLTVASMAWVALLLLAWVWPGLLAPYDPFIGDTSLTRTYEGPG